MINRQQKIIFIGNPRACTTTLNVLLSPKGFDFSYWHDTVEYYVKSIPDYKDYQYFMIVRNPYDRFVSWWSQHRRHNHKFIMKYNNFEEWVKSGEFHDWPTHTDGDPRPPRNYWTEQSPLRQIDFIKNTGDVEVNILKFENIQEEWEDLFVKKTNLYFDSVSFPKTNDTKHDSFETYYTDELKEIVYNHTKEDFMAFGYSK